LGKKGRLFPKNFGGGSRKKIDDQEKVRVLDRNIDKRENQRRSLGGGVSIPPMGGALERERGRTAVCDEKGSNGKGLACCVLDYRKKKAFKEGIWEGGKKDRQGISEEFIGRVRGVFA